MAEVSIAPFGAHLGTLHVVRSVEFLDQKIFRDWFGKCENTDAAIVFVERGEEWFARDNVDIDAGAVVIPEIVLEGHLCAVFPHDMILLRL